MPDQQNSETTSSPRLAAVRPNRSRVVIEGVQPEIDSGRFPIKRTVGESVVVEADVFIDGHEALSCALRFRRKGAARWQEVLMQPLVNDRWRASFIVSELGRYEYTIVAWHDPFKGWRRDLRKRLDADQDVALDLQIGADLIAAAAGRAKRNERKTLETAATRLREQSDDARTIALDDDLAAAMTLYSDREHQTEYEAVLEVVVDMERARFSSWYELFPRSTSGDATHGTFRDVERWLPHIAAMGFDVLYFPPIHPIGHNYRKGKNNALVAEADDVGSPWAIGSSEGGHKAIHAQLGTMQDFERLLKRAKEFGIDIALDIAFQAAPDHPYVKENENWFRKRPDGTIQYAENPPKKYQDIYPFDFDTEDVRGLWRELRSVFEFWIQHGVRIFRVDNPHTKPFPFWDWTINSLKAAHPELIFLAEAFTRPKVMYRLAKLGYTQSYTYFAWRNEKWDLTEYFEELTQTSVREYFRPNVWPNTPDILTEQFHKGERPVFMQRLILAGTLSASYGIYGPAFEHMEYAPREPKSEEYLHSEKYQIRQWDVSNPDSLAPLITLVNKARHDNVALQYDHTLQFHTIANEQLIAYSKVWPPLPGEGVPVEPGDEDEINATPPSNIVLTIVNLDKTHTHSGWVQLPLKQWGLAASEPFMVRDLLTGALYSWRGEFNYVELDPKVMPAHILRLERIGNDASDVAPSHTRAVTHSEPRLVDNA